MQGHGSDAFESEVSLGTSKSSGALQACGEWRGRDLWIGEFPARRCSRAKAVAESPREDAGGQASIPSPRERLAEAQGEAEGAIVSSEG